MQVSHGLYLIAQLQRRIAVESVGGPVGQSGAVRIACLREVHPIGRHHVRKFVVRLFMLPFAHADVIKHISNLRRVIGSIPAALRARRHAAEVVKESFRLSRLRLQTSPGTHLPAERCVPETGVVRGLRLFVRFGRIHLQSSVRVRSESSAGLLLECGRRSAGRPRS